MNEKICIFINHKKRKLNQQYNGTKYNNIKPLQKSYSKGKKK